MAKYWDTISTLHQVLTWKQTREQDSAGKRLQTSFIISSCGGGVSSPVSAELPGQTAGGHRQDSWEGEQQREIHQQPAGASDPGVPQRSGQTQPGKTPESHLRLQTAHKVQTYRNTKPWAPADGLQVWGMAENTGKLWINLVSWSAFTFQTVAVNSVTCGETQIKSFLFEEQREAC